MIINNQMNLDKYGLTIYHNNQLGIYGSKRTLIVETPIQLRGGMLDVGEIGAFTYLGNPDTFLRHVGKIGRFCAIAPDINTGQVEHSIDTVTPHPMFISRFDYKWSEIDDFYDNMDFVDNLRTQVGKTIKRSSYIEIGNDVWIGHGVYISRGVKVGDGAVIAARSVVVKDVPPYSVVGGVPAKIIKQRFSDDVIEKLLKLRWWDYGPAILKGVDITNMQLTLYEIEKRISEGMPKYNPHKIEFNLAENSIYLLSNSNREKIESVVTNKDPEKIQNKNTSILNKLFMRAST